MPLVKPLDREVHLLVSLEVGGEFHAPSGRMVHERLSGWRLSACYLISDITVLVLSLSYIPLARIVFSLVTVFISSALIEAVSSWGVEAQGEAGREAAVERS